MFSIGNIRPGVTGKCKEQKTLRRQESLGFFQSFLFGWIVSAILGILTAASAALFLVCLDWVSDFRLSYPHLSWGLPVVAVSTVLLYRLLAPAYTNGLEGIRQRAMLEDSKVPVLLLPLVSVSTLAAHLVGASVGREGTAVQMAAGLSDLLARIFKINPRAQKKLLIAGLGAGFGSVIGAPWAGIFFSFEFLKNKGAGWREAFYVLICSYSAWSTIGWLKPPHALFGPLQFINLGIMDFFKLILLGVSFGLLARFFKFGSRLSRKLIFQSSPPSLISAGLGSILLMGLYQIPFLQVYVGLGIEHIQGSFIFHQEFEMAFLKSILTNLSLASGFQGGNFIPLVFMGSAIGSAMSSFLVLPVSFVAGLGFVSIYAGVHKLPLTCTILAIELFGWPIAGAALVCCYFSTWFAGSRGD